jgi:DNA-binding transcriptional ArsR family regulator
MVEHSPGLDDVFGALADPTRRAILVRLESNPARVTDIARYFPVSLNAVSKH